MKKTLFAMAALALCGTAVAETYDVSSLNLNGGIFTPPFSYEEGEAVVLNVDQTVTLNTVDVWEASSVTLNFIGENTFSTSNTLDLEVNANQGTLAITGDNDAKIHWGEALTLSAGRVTTLTLASATVLFIPPASASFEGLTESGSITLGDAALTYMGFHVVNTAAEAEALITGDNQIALVANKDTKQLALVGKGAAATPEPATATLSLLALAGMASRRRRK